MQIKSLFTSALVCALGFGTSTFASLVTYDANAAFVAMELSPGSPSSSFGPFSVGYGITPGSFTAFAPAQHTDSFSGSASLQGYFVNNPQIVPAVVVNVSNSPSPIVGNTLAAGQIYLHPGAVSTADAEAGPIQNAILRFTAPTAGTYSILGDWESLHFGTTSKQILVNGQSIFSNMAGTSTFNLSVNLSANSYVDFLVNPAGIIAGDSTGLRATLTTQVAPTAAPPSVKTLAILSKDAYRSISGTSDASLSSSDLTSLYDNYVLDATLSRTLEDGFKANVYRNGDQIVIAVRGTNPDGSVDTVKNLVSDLAITTDGAINPQLVAYARDLALLMQDISAAPSFDKSKVTLTGHSLGGGVAQLVGNASNSLNVTTFDAPGTKNILTQIYNAGDCGLTQCNTTVQNVINQIYSPFAGGSGSVFVPATVNYRLYGDQVSMAGRQGDSEIDTQLGSTITVNNSGGNFSDGSGLLGTLTTALRNHSIDYLINSITAFCPDGSIGINCTQGYGQDLNLWAKYSTGLAQIVFPTAITYCAVSQLGNTLLEKIRLGNSDPLCETLLATGARQGSCRLVYAASGCITLSV